LTGKLIIEPERPDDAERVDAVVRAAFERPAVSEMVAAIRRSPRYRPELTFVARLRGDVVGFVMLSGTDLVDGGGARRAVLTLTPLAVAPAHQRRGIGSGLVRAALGAAERAGEPLVVLEGSPHYYGRLGFRCAADFGIVLALPDWVPPEAAQVFVLPAYQPNLQGQIDYPPAIAALSG
jgi:putative acetyltransferase